MPPKATLTRSADGYLFNTMNSPDPQSKPAGKKLPMAYVYQQPDQGLIECITHHPTLKQARAAATWVNRDSEDRVGIISQIIARNINAHGSAEKAALAVLRAQGSL